MVAMLVAYLPVVIFLGLLLLAIISATCIKLRRRQIRQPLLFARIYKVLHWLILNFFRIGCHRAFIAVHILISASCWSAEPFLLLSSWHQVSPDCRDSRVIGITCAGLEIGLNLYRLLICGAVEKELRYEDALLRVDAASVKFMEVTKCNTCGMQFFGNPENTEGLVGECRAQFVQHFFEAHGDTILPDDFTIETRTTITSKKNADPGIDRWLDDANNADAREVSPGKNMAPNSRGQEFMVHRAMGQPAGLTPFHVHRTTMHHDDPDASPGAEDDRGP